MRINAEKLQEVESMIMLGANKHKAAAELIEDGNRTYLYFANFTRTRGKNKKQGSDMSAADFQPPFRKKYEYFWTIIKKGLFEGLLYRKFIVENFHCSKIDL